MPELLDRDAPYLWLDDHGYASKLFENSTPPLLKVADYVAFRRQAAALLASNVVQLVLDKVCAAWLHEHPELASSMGAKPRAVAPLRAMLADESLRAHLAAMIGALRQAFINDPLVVVLPSPRQWIGIARAHAGLEAIATGHSEVDKASVYVAEFLRAFAECDLDGILLTENASDQPDTADEVAWYQPVFNVASHFRWKTGVFFSGETQPTDMPDGIDFIVAHRSNDSVPTFLIEPSSVWMDASALTNKPGQFTYAEIAHDADPERVLAVIDKLREGQPA